METLLDPVKVIWPPQLWRVLSTSLSLQAYCWRWGHFSPSKCTRHLSRKSPWRRVAEIPSWQYIFFGECSHHHSIWFLMRTICRQLNSKKEVINSFLHPIMEYSAIISFFLVFIPSSKNIPRIELIIQKEPGKKLNSWDALWFPIPNNWPAGLQYTKMVGVILASWVILVAPDKIPWIICFSIQRNLTM